MTAHAAERLWTEHARAVHHYLARRARTPHDAEDLLQEVFLRAVRSAPRDAGPGWLYAVARNALTDHYRRAVHHRETYVDIAPDRPEDTPLSDQHPQAELARCAGQFLHDLPEEQRTALRLVHLRQLHQTTAARDAGVSVSGMKSRVQRGRARLRNLLEACCEISRDARGSVLAYRPRQNGCGC